MKGKWRSRNKELNSENNNKKSAQKKSYRIYLVEPHDYFGIRNMQKTYQQQILLAQQRIEDEVPHFNTIGTEPTRPCKEDDLRILRRSIRPSNQYDGRTRRESFGEAERIRRGDVAVSIPVREIIASRLKSYYNDFIRRRHRKEHNQEQRRFSFNGCDAHPLMTSTNSPCESLRSRRSSLSSRRTRTITETSTETTDSDVFNYIQMRKQVHFGQNTIYSEYSGSSLSTTSDPEDRELSWTERRRRRAQRKAEMEEMNRPKPLLPFLEAGLSYRNEEEFYKLKNAHQNPQLLEEQQKVQKSQRQRLWWPQFLRSLPCFRSSLNELSL